MHLKHLSQDDQDYLDMLHNRQIPGEVQKEIYEQDMGECKICGSSDNLLFDHILSFFKIVSNIQISCARHNLEKGAKFI